MAHWRTFLDGEAHAGRYMPWREVARTTGLSRTTAWRLQKRDDFPAPYAISPGRVGYREEEVEAWRLSRDHSPSRAVPQIRAGGPAAPGGDRTSSDPEPDARSREASTGDKPDAQPPARHAPPARRRLPRRRRSEHARAIAQQMLFDF